MAEQKQCPRCGELLDAETRFCTRCGVDLYAAAAGAPGAGPSGPYETPGRFGGPSAPMPPPKNYLIEAIISTICCCIPLGIASIVYASKVDRLAATGDYRGATEAAAKAKQYAILAVIFGIIGTAISLAIQWPQMVEEFKKASEQAAPQAPVPDAPTEMMIVPK